MSFYLPIIEHHTRAIQSHYFASSSVKTIFSDPSFWSNLASLHNKNINLPEIIDFWKKIQLFAYKSAGELIDLLENHVLPLERAYEYLSINAVSKKSRETIQENVIQLRVIKQQILEGLFLRCEAYKTLKKDPHVDDVIAVLIYQINQNGLLPEQLDLSRPLTRTLNDDRRLIIYDYLRQAGYPEDVLQANVLAPIVRREFLCLEKPEKATQLIDKANQLRNKLLKKSGVNKNSTHAVNPLSKLLEHILALIAEQTGIPLRFLHYFKYFLYFGLSISTYLLLSTTVSPFVSIILGIKASTLVSNALFYSIGIFPVWGLLWDFGCNFFFTIYESLIKNRKDAILNGLIVIEDTAHFIAEKLNSPIIEISHFDIQNLIFNAEKRSADLLLAHGTLKNFSFTERLFCTSKMKEQNSLLHNKLKSQIQKINAGMSRLASRVAKEIEREVEFLEASFESGLKPKIPLEQIEKWSEFIKKYGLPEDLDTFKSKANPINLWIQKIVNGAFIIPAALSEGAPKTPWGTHQLRTDLLRGWEAILKAFCTNKTQTQAAIALSEFLRGKIEVKSERLESLFLELNLPLENTQAVKKAIQYILFSTLSGKVASNASFLEKEQKKQICKWHKNNRVAIRDAGDVVNAILKGESKDVSPKNFSYLDADDIFLHAENLDYLNSERRNVLRTFFEKYKGECDIYHLVRFVPQSEHVEMLTNIASKRLNWILSEKENFTDNDLVLFNMPALKEKFDFDEHVLNNRMLFAQSTNAVSQFEEKCRKNLLGTGHLFHALTSLQQSIPMRSTSHVKP